MGCPDAFRAKANVRADGHGYGHQCDRYCGFGLVVVGGETIRGEACGVAMADRRFVPAVRDEELA